MIQRGLNFLSVSFPVMSLTFEDISQWKPSLAGKGDRGEPRAVLLLGGVSEGQTIRHDKLPVVR